MGRFLATFPTFLGYNRSRTRTIATFRPVSEGEYDFAILCQVCACPAEKKAAHESFRVEGFIICGIFLLPYCVRKRRP